MASRSAGQQPEALRSLKTAAKSGSRKPDDQGMTASGRTAPRSAPLEQEQVAAARVLRAGEKKDAAAMDAAAKKAPKR
jgi:hypothetical protein